MPTLSINGKTHEIDGEPGDSLLSVLRYELGLTGSKFGCGEGHCGACTVLVNGEAVRACQVQVAEVRGKEVVTIEGLAAGGKLHPVQQAFMEHDAMQCGYCTSGMIMTAVGLLARNPDPSEADIVNGMERNLCRCGAHRRILSAIGAAAKTMRGRRS